MGYVTPADVPISDNWRDHRARSSAEPGTDYASGYGTNLRAPEAGQVIGVDHDNCGPAGRRLTLLLDDGRMVDWIHLSEIWVSIGDRFSRGQTGLALSGASRYCDDWGVGSHVHVTLRADRWRPFADTINFEDYIGGGGSGGGWSTADVQTFLQSLGLYDGDVDNDEGPKTRSGIRAFQQLVGLPDDEIFGPNTAAVAEIIIAGHNATDRPTREIQTALHAAGYDAGPIDDDWGNKTSLGEYRWQQAVGLTADAIHGPASDACMFPAQGGGAEDWNLTDRPTADIQRAVGANPDGIHGAETDAKIRAWQNTHGLDVDGIWGAASDGLAFPPANHGFGVDFSDARPSIATFKARGVTFVPRYLWNPLYQDGRTNKGLSRAEHDAYMAAGINVPLIYEEDGEELLGGAPAGTEVAHEAERHRTREGIPARPIYFNVDFDAQPDQYATIINALRAANDVIGLDRTGLYAGSHVLKAAFDAGVITWGMQAYAPSWSKGYDESRAQLRQWSNGEWGGSVDFQWALAEEYGQSPVTTKPTDPDPDLPVKRSWLEQLRDGISKILGKDA